MPPRLPTRAGRPPAALLPRDVRTALRALARTPGLTLAAIATLAVGLGAATAVASYVDAALLRPLPFHDPSRLVLVYLTRRAAGDAAGAAAAPERRRWSYPRYRLLRAGATTLDRVAAYGPQSVNLGAGGAGPGGTGGAEPERVAAEQVAAGYFAALGVAPALGRTFAADEDSVPGAGRVAVLGDRLWRRRFGADPAAVGRTIVVQGEPLVVVGVMPPGFGGLTGDAELWTPRSMAPVLGWADELTTNQAFISVVARLRPGVTLAGARAELAVLGARVEAAAPSEDHAGARWGATAVPLAEARVDPAYRRAVLFLAGAALCLLLVACANVANLLLARAVARRHEMALRAALGAGRGLLVRQLVVEGALLAAAGALAGLPLAALAVRVVRPPARAAAAANLWGQLGEFSAAAVDWRTLAAAVAAVVATTLLCALAPALAASRADPAAALRAGAARTAGAARSPRRLDARALVVAAEVALALVLCAGATLMLESLRRLRATDVGVDPRGVVTFRIEPSAVRYPAAAAPALVERVLARVTAVPGVVAATVDGCAPLGTRCANGTLHVVGRPLPAGGEEEGPAVWRHYVAPGHFRTLGVPLLAGRAFTAADRAGRPKVAIVSEAARRAFWPGEDPIGQRIWFGGASAFSHPDSSAEIVGVVGDVRYDALDRPPPGPSIYTSYLQFTYAARTVIVKLGAPTAGAGAPATAAAVRELRQAVRAADPDVAIFDVRPLDEQLAASWARTRFNATLAGAFAAAALLLAAVGVHAVIAHAVAGRTREIGVRVALGARPDDVRRLVVGQALGVAAIGLAAGVAASLALGRTVQSLLHGVRATEPAVYVALVALLGAVAAAASWMPARRAARVDPAAALRGG